MAGEGVWSPGKWPQMLLPWAREHPQIPNISLLTLRNTSSLHFARILQREGAVLRCSCYRGSCSGGQMCYLYLRNPHQAALLPGGRHGGKAGFECGFFIPKSLRKTCIAPTSQAAWKERKEGPGLGRSWWVRELFWGLVLRVQPGVEARVLLVTSNIQMPEALTFSHSTCSPPTAALYNTDSGSNPEVCRPACLCTAVLSESLQSRWE